MQALRHGKVYVSFLSAGGPGQNLREAAENVAIHGVLFMASICFRAFSFLQAELDKLGVKALDECMAIEENETVDHLLTRLGIDKSLVEAAFINGRVQPLNIPLQDNDRVALIPPGTPGPYRVLLGIRDNKSDRKE